MPPAMPRRHQGTRPKMRKQTGTFVNGQLFQSTKREMQAILSSRTTLVALLAVAAVAGIVGPFGTVEFLSLFPRLAYWLVICTMTYFTGAVLTGLFLRCRLARGLHRLPIALGAGVLSGLVIALEVALLNWVVFGQPLTDPVYMKEMMLNGVSIAVVITLAGLFIDSATADQPPPDAQPPLLDRLPLDKRGPLLSLSVQDHYVEIVTTRGREMLLMRLSDAIRETVPTPGLQVHRSHWVATGQVTAARRDGVRAVLTLADGRDIPVSRSNIAAVREAGLLPG